MDALTEERLSYGTEFGWVVAYKVFVYGDFSGVRHLIQAYQYFFDDTRRRFSTIDKCNTFSYGLLNDFC
jgi:hypothetical protein